MMLFKRRDVGRAFGKILRTARHDAGISQEEMASSADMDRTYPSLLERGLRSPSLVQLLNLAAALQVRPGLLVDITASRLAQEAQQ